jgi:quinol-cytochrome oxidoreductase complex cytochrome b subunit
MMDRVRETQIWKSIARHGYPDTPRNQALVVVSNVFLHLHPVRLRRHALAIPYTFCLGGLSFFMFLVLTITGVLLMFYYIPSVTTAYQNMKDIQSTVTFGQLLRNLHRYAAHAMVITVFLHMCRVFYTGSYKPPREFNWVIGVTLLFCTFLLSFTGYLLPWDELALWAVTVGTNMIGATPLIGAQMRFLAVGGQEVGQNALIRFYTLHVVGLPLLTAVLMAAHFWRVRKDGGISGPL